jgi:hypothetical protein
METWSSETSIEFHGVISQKIELFITSAVRTSNRRESGNFLEVNVKFLLSLIKCASHHDEVWGRGGITLALHGGEWSALCSSRFTSR